MSAKKAQNFETKDYVELVGIGIPCSRTAEHNVADRIFFCITASHNDIGRHAGHASLERQFSVGVIVSQRVLQLVEGSANIHCNSVDFGLGSVGRLFQFLY